MMATHMSDGLIETNDLRGYSICEAGPLYRLARTVGLPAGRAGLVWMGVLIGVFAWLPLVVLTAFERTLLDGPAIPFLKSFGTHARLLLAIPLFFVAEAFFDVRAVEVLQKLLDSRVIPQQEYASFWRALRRTARLTDSWVFETAFAVVTVIAIASGLRTDLPVDVSTWRADAADRLTLAGWWYSVISIWFFQFLLWRWCLRLIIWTGLLWSIARLNLQLIATHPDRAGGLGGLGIAHVELGALGFGVTAMLSASYAEQILFGGANPNAFVLPLAAAIVGTTLLLIAPLAIFFPKLLAVKQRGLLEYGALATGYTRAFEAKWLRSPQSDSEVLGTADIQSLADLSGSFDVIRSMRLLPMATSQIVLLFAAAAIPVVPLVLVRFRLDDIIMNVVKGILHL
jgi:hypothetical protein